MGKLSLIRCEPQEFIDEAEEQFYRSLVVCPFGYMMVLPSSAACRQVIDRSMERGIVLLGDPVCTLDDLAKKVFDSCRVGEMAIEREGSELMIRSIMEKDRSSLSEFEPLWAGIGPTVSELRALFDTWRQFLVGRDSIAGPGKDMVTDHIMAIFDEYQERTAGAKIFDNVGIMECAIQWLKEGRVPSKKVWMIGLNELNPLEKELVKGVRDSSDELVFVIRDDGGKTFNEDLSWLQANDIVVSETPKAESLDRFRNGTELRAQIFPDPLTEARAVAGTVRRLIDSGTNANDICIMLPMREKSASLYREMLEESGVWCNLDVQDPLTRSPIVHVMLDLLDAANEDMPREHIVRSLSSPYIEFWYGGEDDRHHLTGGMVGKFADEAGVIGGVAQWSEKLTLLRQELEREASSPEVPEDRARKMCDKAELITSVSAGLKDLFDLLERIKGTMAVDERVTRIKELLNKLQADKHLEHEDERIYRKEARSLKTFFGILDTMVASESHIPVGREDLGSFIVRVRTLCSNAKHSNEPSYDDAVLVTGIRASMMTRHDHIFVVGMVEGDLPFLSAGNPFIDESDIARLGLLSRSDILRQERLFFLAAMETGRKSVSLSCHRSNDGKKVVSSSFFDEVVGALRPAAFAEEDVHASQIGEQKALGEAIAGKRSMDGIKLSIPMTSEELLRRINVEAFDRVDEYDSPFDGILSDERIIRDLEKLVGPSHVFSPTELEEYASCPLRFYLNRVLRLEPRPELELEISAKDQGTFVHEVAYMLHSQLRSCGMTITAENLDAVEDMAREMARVELKEMRFSGPAWEAFQARMAGSADRKGLLRAFLEYEVDHPTTFKPSHFELSFGRALPERCDPSSTENPASIDLGEGYTLLLAGRIDRVDVGPDGKFLVIDYKTGTLPTLNDVKQAKSLQVQLYLQAVQGLLQGSQGIGGIFYLVKSEAEVEYATLVLDRSNGSLSPIIGRKKVLDLPIGDLVKGTNSLVVEMLSDMRRGIFHPALRKKDCKDYCEFKQVCRFDALRVMDMGGE